MPANSWTALVVLGLALGCSKSHPTASAHASSPPVVSAAIGAPPPAAGEHGEGKRGGGQFRDSVVYVDGQAKGVLRYSELPPALKPFPMREIDALDVARYYSLPDYLQAIGVDLDKVRELHVYGSHDRIAVIQGSELKPLRDRIVFDFTRQVDGKPRARWSQTHALPHRPMVDVIMGISLYVSKSAPTFDQGRVLVDGTPVDDIPYVGDGVPKGTRVYVDGRLEGWVRRKQLPNKLIAPGSDETHAKFSLEAFLNYVGADARGVKAIDFFDDDTLLERVDSKEWALQKGAFVFELPNRSHGQSQRRAFPTTAAPGSLPYNFMCAPLRPRASPTLRLSNSSRVDPKVARMAGVTETEVGETRV